MHGPPPPTSGAKQRSKPVSLDVVTGQEVLVIIDGKEYKAMPLTLNDIGAFKSMIKQRNIRDTLAACPTKNPYEKNDLTARLGRGSLSNEDLTQEFQSPENMLWLIKRSLSRNHPEIAKNGALDGLGMGEVESIASVISSIFSVEEDADDSSKSEGDGD